MSMHPSNPPERNGAPSHRRHAKRRNGLRQLDHNSTEMLIGVHSRHVPNRARQDGGSIDRLLAVRLARGQAHRPLLGNGAAPGPIAAHDVDVPSQSQAPPLRRVGVLTRAA